MTAIVTLTMNPSLDVNSETDQVVANRKLRCTSSSREPGGGGVNVARAVRRLGGEARAVFMTGGITGARLAVLVAEEGVESHPIEIAGETREVVNITERSSGSQYRFVMAGPPLSDQEWKTALETIRTLDPAPRYLVASGTLPPGVPEDFYAQVSRIAAERDIGLIVDTSGPPLQHAVGPGTLLLKPNLAELRDVTGNRDAFSDLFLEGAASALVAAGRARAVVVSMGAAGAIVATERGTRRVSAPTVQVGSRVGAGDSMVAGIVLSLERGMPMEDAALFGIAAGTAAVMTPGTQLCRREDAERLFEEMTRRAV